MTARKRIVCVGKIERGTAYERLPGELDCRGPGERKQDEDSVAAAAASEQPPDHPQSERAGGGETQVEQEIGRIRMPDRIAVESVGKTPVSRRLPAVRERDAETDEPGRRRTGEDREGRAPNSLRIRVRALRLVGGATTMRSVGS